MAVQYRPDASTLNNYKRQCKEDVVILFSDKSHIKNFLEGILIAAIEGISIADQLLKLAWDFHCPSR